MASLIIIITLIIVTLLELFDPIYIIIWHFWHFVLLIVLDQLIAAREAIVKKNPEFYEIISQTGRGGQSDFISLIQK